MRRLACMITLWSIAPVCAQLLTAVNVPIANTSGTTITVEGGLLLNASAVITNAGDLRVQGDWTNNSGGTGLAITSPGNVVLYGGSQIIAGTSVTDFRHLVISGGNKVQQQDAVVGTPVQNDGTVDLNGAILVLNGRTFTVFNPAGTAVSGSGSVRSETTDLLSRFQWALGNDVTGHRIPFSTAGGVSFQFTLTPSAPFAANTLVSVATYPTAPNNTPFPVTVNQQVLHVAGATIPDNSPNTVDRFWLVDLPNGNFTGSMLLSFTPAEDPLFGPGNVRAQRWLESGATWQYPPLPGQTNPGAREVLVPNVLFSNAITPQNEHIWALAYDNTPLPVELLTFSATAIDNHMVRCDWTTAIELNNDFFTVERSPDGLRFEEVGNVPGASNSVIPLVYAFDDPHPYPGLSYYRLRQTDLDGTVSWSEAVPVVLSRYHGVGIFPNPSSGAFYIQRDDPDRATLFELIDPAGRIVQSFTMQPGANREIMEVNAASGSYTLRWEGGNAQVIVGR